MSQVGTTPSARSPLISCHCAAVPGTSNSSFSDGSGAAAAVPAARPTQSARIARRMGITHFDDAPSAELAVGHLRARWSRLGEAAGCVAVGVRRIQVHEGFWSTPCHEHGSAEEIFYVLEGRGLSWQKGGVTEVGPGDCIVYLPRAGAHSVHGLTEIDLLAFGPRHYDESPRFPRLGYSLIGNRFVATEDGAIDGYPAQFVRESELGPPELPAEPGPRPPTIVNVAEVE